MKNNPDMREAELSNVIFLKSHTNYTLSSLLLALTCLGQKHTSGIHGAPWVEYESSGIHKRPNMFSCHLAMQAPGSESQFHLELPCFQITSCQCAQKFSKAGVSTVPPATYVGGTPQTPQDGVPGIWLQRGTAIACVSISGVNKQMEHKLASSFLCFSDFQLNTFFKM